MILIKNQSFLPFPAAPDPPRRSKPLPFSGILIKSQSFFYPRPLPSRPDVPNRCFSKGFQLKSKLFPSPAAPEPPRRSKPLFFYMYDPLMLTPRLVIPDPYLSSSSCAVCTVLGGIPSRNQMRWDAHQVIHLEPLDDGLSHTTFSNNR